MPDAAAPASARTRNEAGGGGAPKAAPVRGAAAHAEARAARGADAHSPGAADAAEQDDRWAEVVRSGLADPALPFERHWEMYQATFAGRRPEDGPPVAWRPPEDRILAANVTALMQEVGARDYGALHAWSVRKRADYWGRAMARLGVPFDTPPTRILDDAGGPEHAVWLPGARMNAAALCLQVDDDATAIVWGRPGVPVERITYRGLRRQVEAVRTGLARLGLRRGDAVALYAPMTPSVLAAYLALIASGLVAVGVADSFAAPEVATRLRLAQAKAVWTVRAFQRAGKEVRLAQKAEEAARAAGGRARLLVEGEDVDGTPWDEIFGDAAGADAGTAPAPFVPCDPYDATNILFSSGTTGEPKAIPWTHLTPIKAAVDGHFHHDIHPGDVVAWPTNMGWMMGPWLVYAALANRATIALWGDVPTSKDFVRFVGEAGVTMLGVVPAIVRAWRDAGVPPHSLPGVRTFSSTGEASNVHDHLYLMSLAGYRAPVIEYCGGTEIGGGHITGTVVQPASPATFTTPALGLDFTILGEDGSPVAPGEHGELYLVPPSIGLSQSLLNKDHHATYYAGCPPGPGGQTLRRHGDQVQWLGGSWWRAQGRADDTMNLGGIKVGSVELEAVMDGHPDVRETAAIAVRPEGGGADRLVAFVVPSRSGVDAAALRGALQERIKARLNPLFRIHDVVVVEALPRTASNKVMRRALRAQYKGA